MREKERAQPGIMGGDVVQAYVTAGNASHCMHRARDLLARGLLTAVRNSGVLSLRQPPSQPPSSAKTQRERYGAVASLRACALRATVTAAIQFGGNREAAAEVARLLVSSEGGCLGPRCSDILASASADSVSIIPLPLPVILRALFFCI